MIRWPSIAQTLPFPLALHGQTLPSPLALHGYRLFRSHWPYMDTDSSITTSPYKDTEGGLGPEPVLRLPMGDDGRQWGQGPSWCLWQTDEAYELGCTKVNIPYGGPGWALHWESREGSQTQKSSTRSRWTWRGNTGVTIDHLVTLNMLLKFSMLLFL